ncbi:hypothetical protein M426DRAFT_7274 [Hypoxylon sp. CI-4A]|nr:hypothetical protein M426DRAFT_7274 [Hypoxylon sp. CI-4A]
MCNKEVTRSYCPKCSNEANRKTVIKATEFCKQTTGEIVPEACSLGIIMETNKVGDAMECSKCFEARVIEELQPHRDVVEQARDYIEEYYRKYGCLPPDH